MPTRRTSSDDAIPPAGIIGEDAALRRVLAQALLVAPSTLPVLVTGETGTGKELLARALHDRGARPRGPFVAVNCGALPRELAESELFGHERGSFTGAGERRAGWFEEAHGGTLVLDEVGELPLDLQPRLLRVLETGRLRRVGGREIPVDVRIVALTLRDLRAAVRAGTFRADLYYRLAGLELDLPPLRRRTADLPALARHFLRRFSPNDGRRLTPGAWAALARHRWPGNVRELRDVIRRACLLGGDPIDEAALGLPGAAVAAPARAAEGPPEYPDAHGGTPPSCPSAGGSTYAGPARDGDDAILLAGKTFAAIEREIFAWALRRHGGSRRRAARALGISRSTFCDRWNRMTAASARRRPGAALHPPSGEAPAAPGPPPPSSSSSPSSPGGSFWMGLVT